MATPLKNMAEPANAWESFSAGDIDGFAQCFSIDATWWTDSGLERDRGHFQFMQTALDATPFHGLVPMTEKIQYIRERLGQSYGGQSIEVSPIRFISAGNRVACEAIGYASLLNGSIYQNRYCCMRSFTPHKPMLSLVNQLPLDPKFLYFFHNYPSPNFP